MMRVAMDHAMFINSGRPSTLRVVAATAPFCLWLVVIGFGGFGREILEPEGARWPAWIALALFFWGVFIIETASARRP